MSKNRAVLWNKNFVQCCLSYFLMNFAFYMLIPTMPVYLSEDLAISPSKVGIVLSSYTVGLMCVRPFAGYLVDCFSRKSLYLLTFTAFASLFAGYLFAVALWAIVAVRFMQGGFMGITSVSGNTITIDVIPSERRGEGMGFYGLAVNLGMSLAPLLAVPILEWKGFHPLVWVSLCIAFVGVFSVSLIQYPKKRVSKRPTFSLDRFLLLRALPAAFSYVLIAIPYGMVLSFVVLYGKENGIDNAGYFFICMALGVGTSRLVSGRLVDRGKIHAVSICSLIVLTLSFVLFASLHHPVVFFLSGLLIGIGYGISVPAYQCLHVNVAPHYLRGTATSTFLTSLDLGVGTGSLLAGFVASYASLSVAYALGAVCCVCSLVVYVRWVIASYEKYRQI